MKFVKNKTYYTGVVYEWNLPTGHTCPGAVLCKVSVNRVTGKFSNQSLSFRCYAARGERFPGVRAMRWGNYDFVKNGGVVTLPEGCKDVRIHASGDFFSQEYFDMWLQVCRDNPEVNFRAFTKSINYWLARRNEIPENLVLTASFGSRYDLDILEHDLKHTQVFKSPTRVPKGMPVDTNDDYARKRGVNFALLDNSYNKKKAPTRTPILPSLFDHDGTK